MHSSVKIAAREKFKGELNDLWHIIDPDIGGSNTWKGNPQYSSTGNNPATHFVIVTPLEEETYDILTGNYNEYEIIDYIKNLANQRDRNLPSWIDNSSKVEDVINSITVNPEEDLKEVQYA